MKLLIKFTVNVPEEDAELLQELDDVAIVRGVEATIVGLGVVPPARTVSDFDVEVDR